MYASVGLDHEAEKLLQAMLKDGCSPDSFTYLALIRAFIANQKFSKAEETLSTMQKEGICPFYAHFNYLLSALAKEGRIRDAERIYRERTRDSSMPDLACHRSMLRGYMDYGHVAEAISLYERISESVEPDKFILSAAVHLYKNIGDELKAGSLLDSMTRMGIPFLNTLGIGTKMKPG
ncbi:Tetratricopeptide repeat (TPR)-like superfamily protein [Thalictrum thalictroides]|uniref:Tetratricopeptide repeat (TPR)-like superfamily protein n=1 Tax=Thalictrum thalictroides TaxID=46969 RepID=A0A7J6UT01_THATH|nr:Tetratricopeptide repeat (TPR)-like superfamily protein [Thalictrum thalictroides]